MKTKITYIFLLFTYFTFGQAETILKGEVRSASDSSSLISGAIVGLKGSNVHSMTNSKGEFELKIKASKDLFLVVNHPNFKQQSIALDPKNTHLTVYLFENITDLPDIVVHHVTMTGGEKGIKELPGSAYYLSPKELQKFNYTDINKVLRSVPGVNLQEEDGFGLRPNIGLRGSGVERSSKITIMEDGILMSPAPYSAPAAYFFPTIGRMQAVEILKGSSQIKFGPFTTGGAINMISTQIPDQLTARVSMSAGSFGMRNLHAFAGNSHEYFGYSVETFQLSSDGFKVLDNGGPTGFNKADYLFKFRLNTKATAKLYNSLTFKFGETDETSNETYLGLTKEDFEANPYRRYAASQLDRIDTKQRQLSVTHVIKPAKFMNITTTLYRNDFLRNWYKLDAVKDSTGSKKSIAAILDAPEDFNDSYAILKGQTSVNSDALYLKGNNRDHYAQGIQTLIGFDFKTGLISHDIDLGIRYHQDAQDRYQYEDKYRMVDGRMMMTSAGAAGRESNRITSAIATASHIQYKLKYKRLTTTAGVRHEYISLKEFDYGKNDPERTANALKEKKNQVDVVIPGISVDYKINTKLAVFAGVHKGFAPPGVTADSKPEESFNYEGGVKFYTNGISAQIVGFLNDYSNLLGAELAAGGGAGTGQLFNGGAAQSQGIEFQMNYDVMRHFKSKINLPVSLGYTYTDAFFKSSFSSTFEDWGTVEEGDKLPYLSTHQISGNISLEHARFSLNFGVKYNSEMRSEAGHGAIPENQLIPSFMVLDASARYHLNKHFSVFVSGTNLSNSVYVVALRPSGYRPGMPRAFQVGLRANL